MYIFIGPSGVGIPEELYNGWTKLPPAKRGDIASLAASHSPAFIALVDGYFDQKLAVGHEEIREAIALGWKIIGLSSMGVIRAIEMPHLGMKGFGWVYRYACQYHFTDDLVTLLHAPAPLYFPVSEPLINVYYFLSTEIPPVSSIIPLIHTLRSMYYGDRSNTLITRLIKENISEEMSKKWQQGCRTTYNIKRLDVISFLNFPRLLSLFGLPAESAPLVQSLH